jgi:branched-chain amino acid transport system ATP-binding protein
VRFGGIKALDRVTFSVHTGEICALIGPNGAGKSTLFNCLSRLYDINEGRIEFCGTSLSDLPRHEIARIGIGRTFQNLALFRSMSVRENILIGCHTAMRGGVLPDFLRLERAKRAEDFAQTHTEALLDLIGLKDSADALVSELPFGTQKRVELARALATEPKLLLLDEPACGLNHAEIRDLGELIQSIRSRLGISILLVEHHMALVMGVSDRVVALNFGRKIAEGSPKEVAIHPEVVKAYLGDEHGTSVDAQVVTPVEVHA